MGTESTPQMHTIKVRNYHHNYPSQTTKKPHKKTPSFWSEEHIFEIVFRFFSVAIILAGLYTLKEVIEFQYDKEYEDVPKGSFWDFIFSIQVFCFIYMLRFGAKTLLYPRVKKALTSKLVGEIRQNRAKKNTKLIIDSIIYAILSIASFILFRSFDFAPATMGGCGSCSKILEGWPRGPEVPYLRTFLLLQFGHQLQILIEHLLFKYWDPKFWELLLHHSIATYLILLSYLLNHLRFGVIALLIHDPADIFVCFVRYYNDYYRRNNIVQFIVYMALLIIWGYTRLFVYPTCLVYEVFNLRRMMERKYQFTHNFVFFALIALQVMHVFWYWHLWRVLINYIFSRKMTNVYDPMKNDAQPKKLQ